MMNLEYFGLTRRPFLAEPSPEGFCPIGPVESAREEISRCVRRMEGVSVVTGDAGSGKTLLCRVLAKQFETDLDVAVLCGRNLCSARTLFQMILAQIGISYRNQDESELRISVFDYLSLPEYSLRGLFIIVDDAHTLRLRILEELRQLIDSVFTSRSGVRLLLVGMPMLEEKLADPRLNAFSQRITTRCYLEPLKRTETEEFLRTQIVTCGGKIGLFSKEVCNEIHRFSQGVPRVIHQLADHVLVTAHDTQQKKITAELVRTAWQSLQQIAEAGPPAEDSLDALFRNSGSEMISEQTSEQKSDSTVEFGSLDDEKAGQDTLTPAEIHSLTEADPPEKPKKRRKPVTVRENTKTAKNKKDTGYVKIFKTENTESPREKEPRKKRSTIPISAARPEIVSRTDAILTQAYLENTAHSVSRLHRMLEALLGEVSAGRIKPGPPSRVWSQLQEMTAGAMNQLILERYEAEKDEVCQTPERIGKDEPRPAGKPTADSERMRERNFKKFRLAGILLDILAKLDTLKDSAEAPASPSLPRRKTITATVPKIRTAKKSTKKSTAKSCGARKSASAKCVAETKSPPAPSKTYYQPKSLLEDEDFARMLEEMDFRKHYRIDVPEMPESPEIEPLANFRDYFHQHSADAQGETAGDSDFTKRFHKILAQLKTLEGD